ncbi:unnamed protein product [Oppiella nova]|uniref:Uncharacterized protein n=1 Tax=Oppiella nova TaxID=334625 RepID=A0A7R9LS51_9ACAR|nr:unnamed protein product [Oppiella nova]CAG2166427.1 unnamed protein product [Oppiella nova]
MTDNNDVNNNNKVAVSKKIAAKQQQTGGESNNKGNTKPLGKSWVSCPCIYCNVIDEDKIILAAQFALGQAKKEFTTRRLKFSKFNKKY